MRASASSLKGDLRDVAITWAVLVLALVAFVGTKLFDIRVPDPYAGDGLSHAFLVKMIIETGWFSHSRSVGAPFGSDFLDYPFADGLHFLLIRIIGLFAGGDWVATSNLFFIGGFFLAAASACVVLRRLGLASPWAIAGGVLFALMPYHLFRRRHLLLASYFAVPIGVYLACVAASAIQRSDGSRPRAWTLGALAVLVGSTGIYYAFFSTFLVAVGGVIGILMSRRIAAGRIALGLVLAIALTVIVNVAPSIAFRIANGPNPEAAIRDNPAESEIYGLRIMQMVIPHPEHRIQAASVLAARYAALAPSINENQFAALGLIGSAGLALMVFVAVVRIAGASTGPPPVAILSALGMAAMLLGTVGGLGAWLAYTLSPAIRAYNRISIVIGFISLAIALLFLQAWLVRLRVAALQGGTGVAAAVAGFLVIVGAFDQTPPTYDRRSDAAFASDRAFMGELESKLPSDTAVLQLPYQPYPEGGVVVAMGQYEPLRGPLNSSSLRWSYGAMRGRAGDRWIRALLGQEPARMIELAAQSGFGAMYVDRRGYADGGAALEGVLRARLGAPIATSADGKLVAFALQKIGDTPVPIETLVSIDTPVELDKPSLPDAVAGISGFSGREDWGRWTEGAVARVVFAFPLPRKFLLRIVVAMAMPGNVDRDIRVRVGSAEGRFQLRTTGAAIVELPMDLPAPADSIEIYIPETTSPQQLGWSEDRRRLGIGIRSVTVVP